MVDDGWDIVTAIPSCTLMFKQELPLMFPDDTDVAKVQAAMYDPFEYLMLRHKDGALNTEFKTSLGKISYQVPCHLRVQNIASDWQQVMPVPVGHRWRTCAALIYPPGVTFFPRSPIRA